MSEDKKQNVPEVKDIEGIGPSKAKQLKDVGIFSVFDLAAANAYDLSVLINSSNESAGSYILAAQKLLRDLNLIEKEFSTAKAVLERREKEIQHLSTGTVALDLFFKGGIETEAITELYGAFGSGKSQICHTCSVIATQPIDSGGLNGNVLYIDTEGTFRAERVKEIALSRELNPDVILEKIFTCKVYNSSHFELIIQEIGKYIDDFKAKLIIIDSIISHHRADMLGRGQLADKQGKLNSIIHKLNRVSEIYKVAIIFTNQVVSDPTAFYGDPTKAAGGNVVAHGSTYRVYLKNMGKYRLATMMDSPYHAYSSTKFVISPKGVEDEEDELAKIQKEQKKLQEEEKK